MKFKQYYTFYDSLWEICPFQGFKSVFISARATLYRWYLFRVIIALEADFIFIFQSHFRGLSVVLCQSNNLNAATSYAAICFTFSFIHEALHCKYLPEYSKN